MITNKLNFNRGRASRITAWKLSIILFLYSHTLERNAFQTQKRVHLIRSSHSHYISMHFTLTNGRT